MSTGAFGGFLCVVGFIAIQPLLLKYLSLHDSGGIFSLHGITGIISSAGSIIITAIYGSTMTVLFPHGGFQFAFTFALVGSTIMFAIVGGIMAALLTKWFFPKKDFYTDIEDWNIEGS